MAEAQEQVLIEVDKLDYPLIANLRRKVILLAQLQPLTEQQAEALTLVLSEHLTNLLEHNEARCQVRLSVCPAKKALIITDTGADISQLWAQAAEGSVPDTLAESGRGLWLIHQYFPDLTYQHSANGNRLVLPLPGPRYRLAVIDDDPTQIALLQVWLGAEYQLDCFTNPLQALDFLKLNPVDLIICDVCMPELDGLSLRRQLLQQHSAQECPFLFLSALDDEQLKHSADELQIDDYVLKPIRAVGFLRQKVRRLLNRQLQLRQSVGVALDEAVTRSLWSPLDGVWQGWQLDLGYLVASRGGGDFVFRHQRPTSMLLVIGDVMGHGTTAKFFAYALSGYLHGLCHAISEQQSPAQLLSQLSAAMADNELLQKTLVTLLVVELHSDGQAELACAGHPAPWLYRPATGLTSIAVQGILPGLQAEAGYQSMTIQLQSQDCLLAGTDGLTEQFPGHDQIDENQLTSALAVLCSDRKPMNLMRFLQSYYQQPLADDLTLLSIRRL